jgi:hypothetical protein
VVCPDRAGILPRNGPLWLVIVNGCVRLKEGDMSEIPAGTDTGDIGEVTLEFIRRYVTVLRSGSQASADDCWRLLLARAKAKEVLGPSAYDRAVALAHSVSKDAA